MGSAQQQNRGLVSVVLPTYNREGTLARAIRSILGQSYENLELIVVDDGSTDGTDALMRTFDDPRLRYIPLGQNRGASHARNVGMRAAEGEFIAFQDSDDEWLNGKLERQIKAARDAGPDPVAVIHLKVMYGLSEGLEIGHDKVGLVPLLPEGMSQPDFRARILKGNFISPQTLMFTRSVLDKVGGFDECLVNSVDWDFAIRLVHQTNVVFIAEPLTMTYYQLDSISRLRRSSARSLLRINQKLARNYPIPAAELARHLGDIGMRISKFGMPYRGRKVLRRALRHDPTNLKNWARLAATEGLALAFPFRARRGGEFKAYVANAAEPRRSSAALAHRA
jgi:glycosyltransferase involved in cell wall biosynthesis